MKKRYDIKCIIMESKFINMLEFSWKQTNLKIEKVDAEIIFGQFLYINIMLCIASDITYFLHIVSKWQISLAWILM